MTLYADRPSDLRLTETSAVPLVLRPGKKPRLPIWYWLLHPRRARWITLLIREAFTWSSQPKPDAIALTHAEAVVLRRAKTALDDRTDATVAKIDQLAERFHTLERLATRESKAADRARERPFVVESKFNIHAGGHMTMAQAMTALNKCRARMEEDTDRGQTRHLDRSSKGWTAVAVVPLLVDIAALFTVILKFFNINSVDQAARKVPETITAGGFAVIASFVLFALSHSAGTDAWHMRTVTRGRRAPQGEDEAPPNEAEALGTGEFPRSRFVLRTKLISMGVVSLMVAISIATRVIHPTPESTPGPLGWTIGITLGVVAFLAPWIVVYTQMKSGSLEAQTVDELTEAMKNAEIAITGHEKASQDAADQAAGVRDQAERAQRDGARSAMSLVDTTREIIYLARSAHGQAGLLAANDSVRPDDSRYLAIGEMLATSTDAIEKAMRRFNSAAEINHG